MFFGFGKRARRQRLAGTFPTAWMDYLLDGVLYYRLLNEAEQTRLREITHILIVEKEWEGCAGQQITDEVKVVIAAQAALLLLGLNDYYFDELRSILVYPGRFLRAEDEQGEKQDLDMPLGEALQDGPVALSWWHANWSGRRLSPLNVVLHEFAHKLAELGEPDRGRPPLLDRALWKRWDEVMTREREQLAEDDDYGRATLLDPYGADDANEFFAVATETFFSRGADLRRRHPDVYELLAGFYRQDPASRRIPPEVKQQSKEREEEYSRHAIAECTAAIESRPDYLDAYRERADYLLALGEVDAALRDYSHVLERVTGEERAEVLLERAAVLQEANRTDEALADLTKAIRLCPNYSGALVERAVIFLERGEREAALADLDESIRLDPRDDAGWRWRAELHQENGQHQEALRDINRALKLNPHDAEGYALRAEVLTALGREEEAQRDHEKVDQLREGEEE